MSQILRGTHIDGTYLNQNQKIFVVYTKFKLTGQPVALFARLTATPSRRHGAESGQGKQAAC